MFGIALLNMDKTELIWCVSKHSLSKFGRCAPTIRLGADIIAASEHVRLLGVTLSSDLSLVKHVSTVSATCFGHLRQIYVGSGSRWTRDQQRHLSTHL